MIQVILFDMDGILFDSEKYYMDGTYTWMKRLGYHGTREELYCLIGTTMQGTYQILYEKLQGKYSLEEIQQANEHYFGIENPLNVQKIMFQDVPESLACFQKMGIKMAVCSSSPYDIIMNALDQMGITSYFDFIESGEHIPFPKPAKDIYEMAQKALGVPKASCLVYEDSAIGIMAGKNAEIWTVAREDLRFQQDQSQADMHVKSMHELVEYVRKENGYARSH